MASSAATSVREDGSTAAKLRALRQVFVNDKAGRRDVEREAAQASAQASRWHSLDAEGLQREIRKARMAMRQTGGMSAARRSVARINALALMSAACERSLGVTPRHAQLVATLGILDGYAVELKAGEGKTLAVAMAAILHAWSGFSCHVVAANEYLAARDAQAMAPLADLCGCTIALRNQSTSDEQATQAHRCDILYATGRQLLSDLTRDAMLLEGEANTLRRTVRELGGGLTSEPLLMTGMAAAVLDDIDAILIEEAMNPLVISATQEHSILDAPTRAARELVDAFEAGRDYVVEREPITAIRFTDEGQLRIVELAEHLPPYWRDYKRSADIFSMALLARDVLLPDRHYAVQNGKVGIADENIQRLMGGYSWYFGIVQAIEARHGLELTVPPRTVARATFQEFFPLYRRLGGVAGNLDGLGAELKRFYRLSVLQPSESLAKNHAIVRRYEFSGRADKMAAVIAEARQAASAEHAVVAAVISLADAVSLGTPLADAGIKVQVLYGRDPAEDAVRLKAAGTPGLVTIIVGPAGRGTQVVAGGSKVVHVLLAEHGDSRRADLLLFDRARCIEGEVVLTAYASLEDEVIARRTPGWAASLRWLARWPAVRPAALRVLIALSQHRTDALTARHRQMLLQREEQIGQQLAFSAKG